MHKNIIKLIIIGNLCLFIWQTALNLSLSTKGDLLNQLNQQIITTKNEIDSLENLIITNNSLINANIYAEKQGFINAKSIRYYEEKLADLGNNN